MNKHIYLIAACSLLSAPAMAENEESKEKAPTLTTETTVNATTKQWFNAEPADPATIGTDSPEAEGFLTGMLNGALDKSAPAAAPAEEPMEYSRTTTKWASVPKFGGYAIGKFAYSSKGSGSNGFSARLIRAYVDGTILKDFKYRLQIEMENETPGPHFKDFFIAWKHWDELEVKVGQFKRCFTFENPYNPWDVGVGDYSQIVKKLAGFGDYIADGHTWNGGRDLGIQLQGDLFRIGKGKQRRALVHYMAGVYNGNGINRGDNNPQKDLIGSLQVQPIKDLWIGVFGWTGNVTYNNVTTRKERYAIGAKYEHNGWSARAEYAHHSGSYGSRADGWYVTAGVPCTKWLKVYAKYDAFRPGANWDKTCSIYSIAPNFQIHKNLMLQLQYNYTHDRSLAQGKRDYHDVWVETYVRF